MSNKKKHQHQTSTENKPQFEVFEARATAFLLHHKQWKQWSHGYVWFVIELRTLALRFIISPNSEHQQEYNLRPRIRSKTPRAYVVKAYNNNNNNHHEDKVFAVRFENEEDSRNFRNFVEKRDIHENDNNISKNINNFPMYERQTNNNATFSAQVQQYNNNNNNNNVYFTQQQQPSTQKNYHQSIQPSFKQTHSQKPRNINNDNIDMINNGLDHKNASNNVQFRSVYQNVNGINNIENNINGNHMINNIDTNKDNIHHKTQTHHHMLKPSDISFNDDFNIDNNYNDDNNYNHDLDGTTSGQVSTFLKLTAANLDIHNKFYPPKPRDIKLIIWQQLEFIRLNNLQYFSNTTQQ